MKTEKLFVNDVYMKECEMTLLELKEEKGFVKAAFDKTVFYPEGGGQLCDKGYINDLYVFDVKEDKDTGIIWHSFESKDALNMEVGGSFLARLDWDLRFNHMQLHCGEHILSGTFKKLFNAENKGFHMGEDYVTIDISCEEGIMSKEKYKEVERIANEVVFSNLPVNTYFFDTAQEAMSLPVRKEMKFGENISIVLIGDKEDPADCCACCGTHPKYTGEVGLIKITHHEKYKGMNRFYVKCGRTALLDYDFYKETADELSRKYSCEFANLSNTLEKEEKRSSDNYKKYQALKSFYLKEEEKKLKDAFKEDFNLYSFEQFTADDLQTLARDLENDIKGLTVFDASFESSLVLASSEIDTSSLIKENIKTFNVRGGGKKNLSRAIFEDKEAKTAFIEHLRNRFA